MQELDEAGIDQDGVFKEFLEETSPDVAYLRELEALPEDVNRFSPRCNTHPRFQSTLPRSIFSETSNELNAVSKPPCLIFVATVNFECMHFFAAVNSVI